MNSITKTFIDIFSYCGLKSLTTYIVFAAHDLQEGPTISWQSAVCSVEM
jgi:hypothetical protein